MQRPSTQRTPSKSAFLVSPTNRPKRKLWVGSLALCTLSSTQDVKNKCSDYRSHSTLKNCSPSLLCTSTHVINHTLQYSPLLTTHLSVGCRSSSWCLKSLFQAWPSNCRCCGQSFPWSASWRLSRFLQERGRSLEQAGSSFQ